MKYGFHVGSGGACEAHLWAFAGSTADLEDGPEIHKVAACSLSQAVEYVVEKHPGFVVSRIEALGIIALVSGSPLD